MGGISYARHPGYCGYCTTINARLLTMVAYINPPLPVHCRRFNHNLQESVLEERIHLRTFLLFYRKILSTKMLETLSVRELLVDALSSQEDGDNIVTLTGLAFIANQSLSALLDLNRPDNNSGCGGGRRSGDCYNNDGAAAIMSPAQCGN